MKLMYKAPEIMEGINVVECVIKTTKSLSDKRVTLVFAFLLSNFNLKFDHVN